LAHTSVGQTLFLQPSHRERIPSVTQGFLYLRCGSRLQEAAMEDRQEDGISFVPPAQPQPLGAIGQCLRASFRQEEPEDLSGEIAALMIQLSHLPWQER
jgi:hypothetical protein